MDTKEYYRICDMANAGKIDEAADVLAGWSKADLMEFGAGFLSDGTGFATFTKLVRKVDEITS